MEHRRLSLYRRKRKQSREGMKKAGSRTIRSFGLAAAAAAAVFVILPMLRWDLYFDLNDDSMMEMIVSGAYTGMPEARNIQSYYPLGLFLSGMYRLFGAFPWYGLFLVLCQAASVALTLNRVCRKIGENEAEQTGHLTGPEDGRQKSVASWIKVLSAAGMLGLYAVFTGYYFVFYHYSVTVGLMACAAAVCLLLQDYRRPFRTLLGELAAPAGMILVGFLLRSEMMLMLLPFVLLACLCGLLQQEGFPGRTAFGKAAACWGLLAVGLVLLTGLNRLGYHAQDWQEFNAFFDARTTLYDFETIPSYEENQAFYDGNNISAEQVKLLENYNFGLDDELDSERLAQIADYAGRAAAESKSLKQRMSEALWDYRHSWTNESFSPYSRCAAALYLLSLCILAAAVLFRKISVWDALTGFLLRLCLFGGRSLIWLYLFYVHRIPDRLTHPMLLMEALILCGLTVRDLRKLRMEIPGLLVGLLILLTALPGEYCRAGEEFSYREEINAANHEYLRYAAEHPDQFYLIDVYSTVAYSYKMFDPEERLLQKSSINQDPAGGWVCKSPLQRKKLAAYGITSLKDALTDGQALWVCRSGQEQDWLIDYFESLGEYVTIEETDRIGESFTVYRVYRAQEQ